MRASFEHLKKLVESVVDVPGSFAEFGVWRGATFAPLAKVGSDAGRICYAVDSFEGMAEPTELDNESDGGCRYKAGSLNAGGTGPMLSALSRAFDCGLDEINNVRIQVGWIPEILDEIKIPAGLAFSHLDLDQYAPTLWALRWVWDRTNPGGVMACHDFWPKGATKLATAAVRTFRAEGNPSEDENGTTGHVWWRKPLDEPAVEE